MRTATGNALSDERDSSATQKCISPYVLERPARGLSTLCTCTTVAGLAVARGWREHRVHEIKSPAWAPRDSCRVTQGKFWPWPYSTLQWCLSETRTPRSSGTWKSPVDGPPSPPNTVAATQINMLQNQDAWQSSSQILTFRDAPNCSRISDGTIYKYDYDFNYAIIGPRWPLCVGFLLKLFHSL